jgi:hypothetical protein
MRLLAFLLLFGTGIAAYFGAFYTTGSQYYEACWERRAQETGFSNAQAKTPGQAVVWASCNPIVLEAFDSAGFVLGSSAEGAPSEAKALAKLCPDRFTEIPIDIDRLYGRVIDIIEKTGGPSFIDRVAPASWLVERSLKARWPRCTDASRPYISKASKADG